jgi:hypothetical protein
MSNTNTAETLSTLTPVDEAIAILREANGIVEEAPPASEERPSLALVAPVPPAVSEAVVAETTTHATPSPLRTCKKCEGTVNATIRGAWSDEHNLCSGCARPLVAKARKAAQTAKVEARKAFTAAAKTCACGNTKSPNFPKCRNCASEERRVAVTTCVCGKKKDATHHKTCGDCHRKANRDPKVQAERVWQQRQSHLRCQGVGCNNHALPNGFCRECLTG